MTNLTPTSVRSPRFSIEEIPCNPIVRKFLSKKFPIPFVVSSKQNTYSSYLAACLDRNPAHQHYVPLDELTDRLPIAIAGWRHKSGFGKVIAPFYILEFNRYVVDSLMDRVMTQLVVARIHGQSVVKSAKSIIDRYEFTETELSLEAILIYYSLHADTYLYLDQETRSDKRAKKVHLSEPARRR